jgi:DnaK suppressor protein
LRQLQTELERERRWLTGTAALEWLSLPDESGGTRSAGAARMNGRLNQVLEALERIENGSYGICVRCRGPIPFDRLEVIPETASCIRCGTAQ